MVFVERRATARVLCDYLSHFLGERLKCGYACVVYCLLMPLLSLAHICTKGIVESIADFWGVTLLKEICYWGIQSAMDQYSGVIPPVCACAFPLHVFSADSV